MVVEIKNKGSFGGEIVIISEVDEEFWNDFEKHNIQVSTSVNKGYSWFSLLDISKVKSNKFAQKLIDIVESPDLADYEIPFCVDYIGK